MPKMRHHEPIVQKRVRLPESMATEIDTLLADPYRGATRYGSLQALMLDLLAGWLRDQKRPEPPNQPDLRGPSNQ